MRSAPSISLELRKSRLLAMTMVIGFLAACCCLFWLSDLPVLTAIPILMVLVGLEGHLWRASVSTRQVVLQPSGYWRLDADEQLWALSASQRFPAGLILLLVSGPRGNMTRRVAVIRDQVDETSWRHLNAGLRASRSVRPGTQLIP